MRKVYPFFFVILALLMSTPKILAAEELGHVNDAKTYWHSLGKATKQLVGQSIDADLSSAIVLELTESDLRQALNIGQTMRGSGGEIILPNADGKLTAFSDQREVKFFTRLSC